MSMTDPHNPCRNDLSSEKVLGLSFTALSGFISSFAVIFVFILVARNYIRNVRNPPPGGEWKLIRTHVDAYLLSLLASDLLQGLGAILDIKWAAEKQVYCSATCTAQGAVQVIGETGVAMATFAIALHTFLVIFFRWSPSPRSSWIWKVVIAFIWLYVCIYAIAGYATHNKPTEDQATSDAFYTPTPYWCWISGGFNAERITGEYLWLWFAAFSSIVLYTFLFLRVRGNITVDPHNWKRVRFVLHRWHAGDDAHGDGYFDGPGRRGGEAGKTAAREAMSMIWYPLTYTALVLPLSIVRWSTFRPVGQAEPNVPFAVTCVVVTVFGLSGIVNVALILLTRKNLLLFGQRGVVNPAKIGLAATGRMAAIQNQNRDAPGGGPGGAGAPGGLGEKRGRFHFREMVGAHLGHQGGDKREHDESTSETMSGENQQNQNQRQNTRGAGANTYGRSQGHGGDTSFAAGRFTTGAYETDRSFDVGSGKFGPQSPIEPGSATAASPEAAAAGHGPGPGPAAYGYGYSYGDSPYTNDKALFPSGTNTGEQHSAGGIPEGMSRDLGSAAAGEYDVDREREWRSFGSTAAAVAGGAGVHSGMLKAPGLWPEDVTGDQQQTLSQSQRSNFLEMKDSRSNPGNEQPHEYLAYPPAVTAVAQAQERIPHPHQQFAEGRRGSAGNASNRSATTRPGSSKSRGGGDDYSVPMKFNPTPAPPANHAPATEDVPYNKSKNGSSKSLGRSAGSKTTTNENRDSVGTTTNASGNTSSSKAPWSGLSSIFTSSSSSSKRDSLEPPLPSHPHHHHHLQQQQQHGQGAPPMEEGMKLRPLHFSRDFGPKLRSSLSLNEPQAEERHHYHQQQEEEYLPPHAISPFDDLARARTRTPPSHEGYAYNGQQQQQQQQQYHSNNSGSWSRATGKRNMTHHPDDDRSQHRPTTAGSGRSAKSYTFGPPGLSNPAYGYGGSHSSLKVDSQPPPQEQERVGWAM